MMKQQQPKQISFLICPFCGLVYQWITETIDVSPFDYSTNKVCASCQDVELLFFGMSAGSWGSQPQLPPKSV
jgi:hypothetical protein